MENVRFNKTWTSVVARRQCAHCGRFLPNKNKTEFCDIKHAMFDAMKSGNKKRGCFNNFTGEHISYARFKMTSTLKGLIICHFCGIELSNTYWNVWVKEHNNKPIWAFVRLCAKCTMFESCLLYTSDAADE